MEQDLGSEHTRSLHRYILPASSLPPQEDRAGVHSWRAEQHHRCLRVLCVQPQAAHGDEVQGGRVLRRQPTAAAHCWKNAFEWSRSAWDYISRHQHWWGLPYSDRPWCGVGNPRLYKYFTKYSGSSNFGHTFKIKQLGLWENPAMEPPLDEINPLWSSNIWLFGNSFVVQSIYQDHLRLWRLGSEE